ncbi:MAG: DUF4340 domain-containing protein [Nitrococcus sp.]|nr:DUF4340 domain-containing protein [Nitrococcus sp.]
MKRMNTILAAVLAAQLLLAGALLWNSQRYALAEPGQPLLVFEPEKVDRIVIDTPEEGSITLQKDAQGWHLPSRDGFAAAESKVDGFLAALRDLNPRLPVAITENAMQRFQVGAEHFERRITLKHGEDTLTTLYLGESAGPSRVYARPENDEAIYEIPFGLWQASTEPTHWMARNLLHQPPRDIVRIDLPSFTLQRKDDKWRLVGLNAGAATNEDEAARIVQRLANLTFEDVKGKVEESASAPAPELSYTLTFKNGDSVKYRFSKAGQGDAYLLTTSTNDYIFKVSKETVDAIHDFKRDALVKKASDEKGDKSAPTGSANRSGADKAKSHS